MITAIKFWLAKALVEFCLSVLTVGVLLLLLVGYYWLEALRKNKRMKEREKNGKYPT